MEIENKQRHRITKIPKSAIALYSHLYCKKKGNSSTKYYSNLVEATKSWATLTEEEKHKFVEKLEACHSKYQNQLANYLKDVEPYLKKKPLRVTKEQGAIEIVEEDAGADHPESIHRELANESDIRNDNDWVDNLMETVDPHGYPCDEFIQPLTEPQPPSIKSSLELFNIVKAMDKENKDEWRCLNKTEKTRYRRAMNKIKNDYITKYKAYLESLPSQQLIEHYQKTINSDLE